MNDTSGTSGNGKPFMILWNTLDENIQTDLRRMYSKRVKIFNFRCTNVLKGSYSKGVKDVG